MKSLNNKPFQNRTGVIFSSLLLGLPLASLPAIAQTYPERNPCPGIFYEEPFNSTREVPQGCRPNTFTQSQIDQGKLASDQYRISADRTGQTNTSQTQAPAANNQLNVIATIPPNTSSINVRLKNTTNTQITYQVTGQTNQRILAAGEEVNLQGLSIPVTFTMNRSDGGFIKATPISTSDGELAVSLNATGNPDESQRTLRIQQDGQVLAF